LKNNKTKVVKVTFYKKGVGGKYAVQEEIFFLEPVQVG